MRCAGLGFLATTLTACTTSSLGQDHVFQPGGSAALVAIGLPDAEYGDAIRFVAIDPATCRVARPYRSKTFRVGDALGRIDTVEYRLADWEPGVWVVDETRRGQIGPMVISYEDASIAFDVREGRLSYLGDFEPSLFGSPQQGYRMDELRRFLAPYAGIRAEPETVQAMRTAYSREADGGRIAGCRLNR